MVVQHNLTAMNSNRMLNVNTKTQAKSTEKLSSGFKINRAADDAAGLSISEKMRKQIRGLTQASANAQDGISAVQTAEGALNEVQDMLQRMNELAVKAANGTNSTDDRTYIQNEIDQLVSEIDRVAETTKFNETYLLKGDKSGTQTVAAYSSVAHGTSGTALSGTLTNAAAADATFVFDGTNWFNATANHAGGDAATVIGAGTYAGTFQAGDTAKITAGSKTVEFTEATRANLYDANGNRYSSNALDSIFKNDGTFQDGKAGTVFLDTEGKIAFNPTTMVKANFVGTRSIPNDLTLKLHVGADATSNNQISVDLAAMSATGIGVNGLKVDGADDSNALDAIETIKAAIQKISTQRSALGAVQNRLDHTINNLDNVVENTTSAESSIRDTDMATEMVRYSNNNILAQAGQAMLAQANQSNQGVLSLLG